MVYRLFRFWFKYKGWTCENNVPSDLKKYVLIGAPHTSNYDFIYGITALNLMNVKVRYLAKKELFKFPLKNFFLNTGGIPVDRSKKGGMVSFIKQLFEQNSEMVVLVPPEGTRGKVDKWKTGFYYAAVESKVPIVLGYLDYGKKKAALGNVFYPTGNIEKDFESIREYYRTITPKHKQNFDPEMIRP